jgi:hypothetical protein
MALRDKIAAEAAPHLEPGEQVQHVFAAQAASPQLAFLSIWIIVIKDAHRAVVATDRRIIVFRTSRWRWTKFKAVERVLPRSTRIGEPEGLNWKTESLGELLWINKRFHNDVRAADADAPGTDWSPPTV